MKTLAVFPRGSPLHSSTLFNRKTLYSRACGMAAPATGRPPPSNTPAGCQRYPVRSPLRSSRPRQAEFRLWPQGRLTCATHGSARCAPQPPRTEASRASAVESPPHKTCPFCNCSWCAVRVTLLPKIPVEESACFSLSNLARNSSGD